MELNVDVVYDVVDASNSRGERETQATQLQENIAYIANDISLSIEDKGDNNIMVENNGRELFASKTNTAYASTAFDISSVLDNNKNTKRKRQGLAKNACAKPKWLPMLAVVVFVLSLLVAVAALVYTNIELKNQMSSTNKQVQSMREQLNNQSSQLSNSILALSSNINEIVIRDLNDVQSIIAELGPMAFYPGARIGNPASSCSDIPQGLPSGEYWIATDSTSSPVQVYCDMNRTSCSCNTTRGWMRVANLDMTNSHENCPEELRLITRSQPPLRTCGRHRPGCVSTTYSTYGVK